MLCRYLYVSTLGAYSVLVAGIGQSLILTIKAKFERPARQSRTCNLLKASHLYLKPRNISFNNKYVLRVTVGMITLVNFSNRLCVSTLGLLLSGAQVPRCN